MGFLLIIYFATGNVFMDGVSVAHFLKIKQLVLLQKRLSTMKAKLVLTQNVRSSNEIRIQAGRF